MFVWRKWSQNTGRDGADMIARLRSSTTKRSPGEKFGPTPSTFRHGSPLRVWKRPKFGVRRRSENNSLTSHIEFLKAQVSSPLFFPEFPAGREIASGDARAAAAWRHPPKKCMQSTKKNKKIRLIELTWTISMDFKEIINNIVWLCSIKL